MQELLANFRKHIDISPAQVEKFMEMVPPQKVKKNGTIIKQGEAVSTLLLIKNGCVMTFHEDESKTKHVIQFSLMGWWTADFQSFKENSPSDYTIKAMSNSTYCEMDLPTYERICQEIPVLETYFRRLYQSALVSHQKRIISNISFSAEKRYENFIEEQPHIEQLVAQKYIASYLGMSPEFLSKIKARRYENRKG